MADHLSEEDAATFRVLAFIERTTAAEQRRRALRARAQRARRDKNVAELVEFMLAGQERRRAMGNVVELSTRRVYG